MDSDHGGGGSRSLAQSGLRRLMLRLPEHRRRLQSLSGSTAWADFCDLLAAYDEACIALEMFRRDDASYLIIEEYELLSAELEAEIVCKLDGVILWPRDG